MHSAGEEFWLTFESPTEVSSVILRVLDNQGMRFASVSYKEFRTNILEKPYSPCRNYAAETHDKESFIECSKNIIRRRLTPALNCTLNGMEELIEKSSGLSGEFFSHFKTDYYKINLDQLEMSTDVFLPINSLVQLIFKVSRLLKKKVSKYMLATYYS